MVCGGGTVLIYLLTAFSGIDQHISQGANLVFFIPTCVTAIVINIRNKKINYEVSKFVIIFGIIGAIIGARLEEKSNFSVFESLYYLNTVGIKAITIEDEKPPIDIEEKNVKSTTDDITSYEQFIEWIKEK